MSRVHAQSFSSEQIANNVRQVLGIIELIFYATILVTVVEVGRLVHILGNQSIGII